MSRDLRPIRFMKHVFQLIIQTFSIWEWMCDTCIVHQCESWLCFRIQLPASAHFGRQQVVAQGAKCLSPTWDTWIVVPLPDIDLSRLRLWVFGVNQWIGDFSFSSQINKHTEGVLKLPDNILNRQKYLWKYPIATGCPDILGYTVVVKYRWYKQSLSIRVWTRKLKLAGLFLGCSESPWCRWILQLEFRRQMLHYPVSLNFWELLCQT